MQSQRSQGGRILVSQQEREGVRPARRPLPGWLRQTLSFLAIVLVLGLVWEGVKLIGGDIWRLETPWGLWVHRPPLRFKIASDLNMPHLWDIFLAFGRPAARNGPPLISVLLETALFTLRVAFAGFALGALLGLVLGTLFAHSPLLERGLVPYVVASQTIPILAIAPMVVVWLGGGWWSVAIISAYLTFFPVTINTLRGLRSPDPRAVELMRSYASSTSQIFWKLRLPAALPAIFTALKISATASIVGAIIGELPAGVRGGLGGAILNFNQYYISGPQRLWATIIVAAGVGITFFVAVRIAELLLLSRSHRLSD